MYENIPFSDFKQAFENYMGCWTTIVFAGLAINEGQRFSPLAMQIWASDTEEEQTEVFGFPQIPQNICMFKITRWLAGAWPMVYKILDQKDWQVDDIKISFEQFRFSRAAFLSPDEYNVYPPELHEHVDIWPKLFLEGMFANRTYLDNEFGAHIEEEFRRSKYLFPTLLDAANHLVGIKVSTNYLWGTLYAALKIPIKLQLKREGFNLSYKLELPENLGRMPIEMRYTAKSKLGERQEPIPISESKETFIPIGERRKRYRVFSSSVNLSTDDEGREVLLFLGNRRVHSVKIPQVEPGHKTKAGNKIEAVLGTTKANKKVFVIHGRNEKLRKSMVDFLNALRLEPLKWNQLISATRKGSPYIGEILDEAFEQAQAVVVLLTGDDEARLQQEFIKDSDPEYEKELIPQARPNVLFESGMAIGKKVERTILVQIGGLRPWSDIGGRHVTRLDNTTEKRQELIEKLKNAGCDVDISQRDWQTAGDFGGEKLHPNDERDREGKSIKHARSKTYCLKCHSLREIKNPKLVILKSGRRAIKGACPVCGAKLFRMK